MSSSSRFPNHWIVGAGEPDASQVRFSLSAVSVTVIVVNIIGIVMVGGATRESSEMYLKTFENYLTI